MDRSRKKLVLLGPAGSFSDIAADKLKINCKKRYVHTLGAVFRNIKTGDLGLVPVKNKIIGAIKSAKRINSPQFKIIKRFKVPIRFVLASKKKVALKNIRFLYGFKPANNQCGKFIKLHFKHVKKINSFGSTGAACKKVVQQKGFSAAAIGSRIAARQYKLKVLADNIQDEPNNWTEFVLFSSASS